MRDRPALKFEQLIDLCGVDYKRARYVLGEGADGSSMTRTLPMEMVESGEVLLAYGQNGEMLRPENGYPLRLVVPGVQGVSWVKYLRRVEVGDKPYAAKDEAIHYIDLQPDGTHRQYTNLQEVKSVVTTPSGGQVLLDKGFYNITGLAWSGKGKIKRRTKNKVITVPKGHVFLVGDNKDNSFDSRHFGTVPISAIKGRAASVLWSTDGKGNIRWKRIGMAVK